MWEHYFNTHYHFDPKFICLVGYLDGEYFSMLPIVKGDDYSYPLSCIKKFFRKNNQKIKFRGIPKEYLDAFSKHFDFDYEVSEDEGSFDYIYEADNFRFYKGKKLHKKRNNLNKFLKDFDGRFEYKTISPDNFKDVREFMIEWSEFKTETETLKNEEFGIQKLLDNYKNLDYKISGVYIDGKLEAFTIGNKLNPETVVIHIEKANPKIRGLYQYISQQFLVNEYPEVSWVNRQEDLGIEGLRKSKMSYRPCCFGEKVSIDEV